MDEGLSQAVLEAFIQLYEEGLIYRGQPCELVPCFSISSI
ncbi:hypothetical protein [Synechococcus elongatus]